MPNVYPKPTGLKTFQLRIRLIQIFSAYFLLANNVHAIEARQENDATVVVTVPRTKTCMQKTDYCTLTNSIMLIEKIIERRCLLTVWLERWNIGSNSVDVIEKAKLTDSRFQKDIRGWLSSIATYPDETLSTLTEEVSKETELMESLGRQGSWKYDDFVKQLTDQQRCRFLARLFQYKAIFYSFLETEFAEAKRDKEGQRNR